MLRFLKAWFNRTFRSHEIDFRLKSLEIVDGKMDMAIQTSVAPLIATEFVKFFRDNNGTNYVTFSVFDEVEMVGYDVIVQKRSRPDMAKVNSRLRTALEDIEISPQSAKAIADKTLRELGYKK